MRRRHLGKLLVGPHVRTRLATPAGRALRGAATGPAALAALGLALLAGWSGALWAGEPAHPLDPLSAVEYRAVYEALDAAGHAEETTFFPLIQLDEPDKKLVLGWRPGEPAPRRAFVVVMKRDGVFEAVIDLDRRRLASWTAVAGVQPGILLSEEWLLAQEIVRAHAPWREALGRRGIENVFAVVPVPLTVGAFGDPRETTDRLVKVISFDSRGVENYWGRPIEGLVALVSLKTKEVLELADHVVAPIPAGPVDFDRDSLGEPRADPAPITLAQPGGPGYRLDGHQVSWQNWSFHWRIDPRLGSVLSQVRYRDGDRDRAVLYQASLSEMFVPYTDPGPGWYFRGYMDAGEYGIGQLLSALVPGLDCPTYATFFPALLADEYGNAIPRPNVLCLFERSSGDVAWRHHEAVTGRTEGRRATELVLRSIPAVGNYDYLLDWVLRQDGSIEVAIGATGLPQVKAAGDGDGDGDDDEWGRRVAPNTVAISHDHFFSFRLDLDIDGTENSLRVDRLRPVELGDESPRRTSWKIDPLVPARELDARLTLDLARPALWRVINPGALGPNGYPASYHLAPGRNTTSLFAPHDDLARRAGFIGHHLWVTAYDRRERHAAGDYPNQSRGGDGLPAWVSKNRPIEDRDIVLWYTMGVHHVVRSEDWPVMPTTWQRFELRPFDFFGRNPALDLAD